MKIVMIAPRFHINQLEVVKSLMNKNHDVHFISYMKGIAEDYKYLEPEFVHASELISFIARYIPEKKRKKFLISYSYLSIKTLRNIIRKHKPDVVIIRGVNLTGVLLKYLSKVFKFKLVLYIQRPVFKNKRELKETIEYLVSHFFISKKVYSPVLGNKCETKLNDFNYIPFVVSPKVHIRSYNKNGIIQFIAVGKYIKRKRLRELVGVFANLILTKGYTKIKLTIVGTLNLDYYTYYEMIKELVKDKGLTEYICLKTNVEHAEVIDLYKASDFFILPSSNEPASYSQFEAMACGLGVCCSSSNGTAMCIKDGYNGFVFKNKNFAELEEQLEKIICNTSLLESYGKNSLTTIINDYGLSKYADGLEGIL